MSRMSAEGVKVWDERAHEKIGVVPVSEDKRKKRQSLPSREEIKRIIREATE